MAHGRRFLRPMGARSEKGARQRRGLTVGSIQQRVGKQDGQKRERHGTGRQGNRGRGGGEQAEEGSAVRA